MLHIEFLLKSFNPALRPHPLHASFLNGSEFRLRPLAIFWI